MISRHKALGSAVVFASLAVGCGGDDGETKGTPAKDASVDAQVGDAEIDGQVSDAQRPPLDAARTDGGKPVLQSPFAIYGSIGSAPGNKRNKQAGDAAVERSITHVMAVNPATANPVRYVEPVAADGSFAIGVDLNVPWVFVLVDANEVGRRMIAGVFRGDAFDLDSLAATRPGMLDLGALSVDAATGAARTSVSTSTLLSSLGLSEAGATLLGSVDDVSLRYVNPDIDGNGEIDALENVAYPLDFHIRYDMRVGSQDVTLLDLLAGFSPPETSRTRYTLGSAIVSWAPTRFGTTSMADYRVRFPDFAGNFVAPPNTGSFARNEWITGSGLYLSAGSNSVGVSFDATQPFPTGEYVYEVKGTELTFTDVRTHTLTELNAADGLIVPFLSVTPAVAGCSAWTCPITGFGYRWMKRAGEGFTPATAEEVALLVPQNGGFISFRLGGDVNKQVGYTIPGSPVTGTIALTAPSFPPQNVTSAELTSMTVGQVCHLGVSYDDTLGMRIFQGYRSNPACTP